MDVKQTDTAVVVREHAEAPMRQSEAWAMSPAEFGEALESEKAKRKMLLDYVRGELIPGVDWMLIHAKVGPKGQKRDCPQKYVKFLADAEGNPRMCEQCGAKPTLVKSGAEKMCSLLHVAPAFTLDRDTMDALELRGKGVAYVCHLASLKTGAVLAEGRGAALHDASWGDMNKTIKMAQKSAQTDAVLRLCSLSSLMTQDLDTLPAQAREAYENDGAVAGPTAASPSPRPAAPGLPRNHGNCRDCGENPCRCGGGPADDAIESTIPVCPKCGGPMKLRNGKKGLFYGCTGYPDCKGTAPYHEPKPDAAAAPDADPPPCEGGLLPASEDEKARLSAAAKAQKLTRGQVAQALLRFGRVAKGADPWGNLSGDEAEKLLADWQKTGFDRRVAEGEIELALGEWLATGDGRLKDVDAALKRIGKGADTWKQASDEAVQQLHDEIVRLKSDIPF